MKKRSTHFIVGTTLLIALLSSHEIETSSAQPTATTRSLLVAAASGETDAVRRLLIQGVDVNTRDGDGWTALMFASAGGHDEVARLLLIGGADVNAISNDGASPLFAAALNGHLRVVELLVSKGANVNDRNKDGLTARDLALRRGQQSVARFLERVGSSPASPTDSVAKEGSPTPEERDHRMFLRCKEKEAPRDVITYILIDPLKKTVAMNHNNADISTWEPGGERQRLPNFSLSITDRVIEYEYSQGRDRRGVARLSGTSISRTTGLMWYYQRDSASSPKTDNWASGTCEPIPIRTIKPRF